MAGNTANIKAVITAEDKASAVLKGFGDQVDKTSENASNSVSKLSGSFLAVTAATAGLVAFGKKSLDAFNDQDLAVTRLRAGIQNVTSATDKNIDGLIRQASALQKVTRFSDEQYISAQGILSTYQLNQKAIEKLTPRLADMSEGLAKVNGGLPEMEDNAKLVAKAIGGEDIAGLTGALRKAGVIMTETQMQLLKTGTVEERVALVTQVLDQNFKGMAEAAGGTTAGKIAQLKNQFNDLEEKVGGVIATALTPLLNLLLQHPAVLTSVTIAVGTLTTAFVALKVAAAISTTFGMATAGITQVGGAATIATGQVGLLSASLATPMVMTIAVGAALIAIQQVYTAYMQTKQVMENTLKNIQSDANAAKGAVDSLNNSLNGTPAQAARAQNAMLKLGIPQSTINKQLLGTGATFATGGFTGQGNPNEIAGMVHKGEFVLPQSMVDQSTGLPKMEGGGGGGTVNITVQAGAFMGSQQDARRYAEVIMSAMKDIAGAKNMNVQQMLGM